MVDRHDIAPIPPLLCRALPSLARPDVAAACITSVVPANTCCVVVMCGDGNNPPLALLFDARRTVATLRRTITTAWRAATSPSDDASLLAVTLPDGEPLVRGDRADRITLETAMLTRQYALGRGCMVPCDIDALCNGVMACTRDAVIGLSAFSDSELRRACASAVTGQLVRGLECATTPFAHNWIMSSSQSCACLLHGAITRACGGWLHIRVVSSDASVYSVRLWPAHTFSLDELLHSARAQPIDDTTLLDDIVQPYAHAMARYAMTCRFDVTSMPVTVMHREAIFMALTSTTCRCRAIAAALRVLERRHHVHPVTLGRWALALAALVHVPIALTWDHLDVYVWSRDAICM